MSLWEVLAAASPSPSETPLQGEPRPAIDPTLLALLSIFGGALLTASAGFWGAWRQSKREHTRWVRERRYEAYLDFVRVARSLVHARESINELRQSTKKLREQEAEVAAEVAAAQGEEATEAAEERSKTLARRREQLSRDSDETSAALDDLNARASDAAAPFYLLGPAPVAVKASRLAAALRDKKGDPKVALSDMEKSMRAALSIKDYQDGAADAGGHPRNAAGSGPPTPGAGAGRAGT